jgi:uncharacterized pyridoxamine 5'-phosphate oxidase family protein
MNFSSYEELYDVFKNTAVFYKSSNTNGEIEIPEIELDTINVSYGDNVTVAIINPMFDNGYVKFNGNLINRGRVTIPQTLSSNTNRDEKFREKLPGLFVCKKEKNMSIPFDLSTYYNPYLLNRKLIFKARLRKKVHFRGGKEYIYYRTGIVSSRHDDAIRYSYGNSKYNCYYINLDNRNGKNIIKDKETELTTIADGSYAFTLPREKALNSPFSEGDKVQVIAQRTKEMFNFPLRAK